MIGPGLLGGSALLAIKERGKSLSEALHLAVWARRQEPIDDLLATGAVDTGSTQLEDLFADPGEAPDLVILATPIGFMPELAEKITALATKEVVVTDVGSTKGKLVEDLDRIFAANPKIRFVGSHPMAGSEKTGLDHASSNLFEGAACILTPTAQTDPDSLRKVEQFWQWLGCKTTILDPGDHDEVVARISHLPHIVAAALVHVGMKETDAGSAPDKFSGGGFRDTTRIAGGHAGMWTEILLENRQSICDSLGDLIQSLESVRESLEQQDVDSVRHFLADAKDKRDALTQ